MATKTVTIYASGSSLTDSANPNIANTKEKIGVFDVVFGNPEHNGWWDGQATYEQFVPPAEILGKRVTSAKLYVYARNVYYYNYASVRAIAHAWDPKETTWNNSPTLLESSGVYLDGNPEQAESNTFAWRYATITDEIRWDYLAHLASFGFVLVGGGSLYYYTANSDKKPYIVLTYEDDADAGLYAAELNPNGSFRDERDGVSLSWSPKYKTGTIEPTNYKKVIASWNFSGESYSKDITNNEKLPANQLPGQGTVTWSVTITDTAGNVNTSETATFYTTDSTLYAEPVTPINAYIDGSKSVDLNWRWSISTGTRPTKADFQTSEDGGTTWDDLGSITDPEDLTYHTVPNELPAGSILWRVRGYNTDGVAGPWSAAAAVVVRRAPDTPVISGATNLPKPTVSWQAEGQQAYQLQIGTWDSGTVFGTAKTDQCPEFLPDGPTAVRLRVQNTFGMWSQWAETTVTITNIPGEAIAARALARRADIRITWETKGEYPEYLIYRAGEVIGVTAGKQYIDHTAIGKAAYTVRGVNYNSTYTDSPPVTEILTIQSGLIALEGEWDWMLLDRRVSARPARSGGEGADVTYSSYSGRALPVAELSGHRQRSHSYTYSLPTKEDVDRLARMSGQRVVYKHKSGERAAGILGNVSWAWNRPRWDVSFTVTEVDHGPVL